MEEVARSIAKVEAQFARRPREILMRRSCWDSLAKVTVIALGNVGFGIESANIDGIPVTIVPDAWLPFPWMFKPELAP